MNYPDPFAGEPVSVLKEQNDRLYHKVRLHIQFRGPVLAGLPKGGNPLDYFMNARHMSDAQKEDFQKRVQAGTLTPDELEEVKNTNWCCFERDHAGNLCLWHGNVKAMMREIFVTLGLTQRRPNTKKPGAAKGKGKGKKLNPEEAAAAIEGVEVGTAPLIADKNPSAGGRQTFQHAVHVDPLRIPFERVIDGEIKYIKVGEQSTKEVAEVAGTDESADVRADERKSEEENVKETIKFLDKVKHIKDMNGTRSALGRHDMLEMPFMTIYLKWPYDGVFGEEDMKLAWAACEEDGLGACRSQGFGKFRVVEWTTLNDPRTQK